MTAVSLAVDYSTLLREIGRFLGYGRDSTSWTTNQSTDVEDILRSGVRRALVPPPMPNERRAHEWSFLRPAASMTTSAPYTTGTIGIVDGVVTGLGTTFPSWATQGAITVSGGTYAVSVRGGNTSLTLADTSVQLDAGSPYSLGRWVYDMPSDFAMIDGPLTYSIGSAVQREEIPITSEFIVRREMAWASSSGYPRMAAIRPKAIDETASTAYEMLLSPIPDDAYPLNYRYRVNVTGLDSTNKYPPGGEVHGELFLEACLSAAEQKMNDSAGLHTARFMECLAASISHDRAASSPDTLGMNYDGSDRPTWNEEWERATNNAVLYNGVAY